MKHQPLRIILFLALTLGGDMVYAQGSLGSRPKKARTPEDYTPRTLKEVAKERSEGEDRRDLEENIIVHGDIFPSRVRATYTGRARPLPQIKKDVLHRWAQRYAGAPKHYTRPYDTELLFTEDGLEHWLAVRKQSVAQFEKELKKGEVVDLYLIRLGGVRTADEWQPLLLVESFQRPKLPR
jgi:hypothetical protein